MSTAKVYKWTPEEYLAMERASVTRHELIDGEVYAMSGASFTHNVIVTNLTHRLANALEGRPCVPCSQDLRVRVHGTKNYVYPDLSIVCGKPELESKELDVLLNPTAIVEVLSKSTEDYDRGTKLQIYRQIPTVRHYVLVSQDSMAVEHHVRQAKNQWMVHLLSEQDSLIFADLDVRIPISDIYQRVEFPTLDSSC